MAKNFFPKLNFTPFENRNVKILVRRLYSPGSLARRCLVRACSYYGSGGPRGGEESFSLSLLHFTVPKRAAK